MSATKITLTDEEAQNVRWALTERLHEMAKVATEEIERVFEEPERSRILLADAAWKVREQARLVDVLERIGFEGVA